MKETHRIVFEMDGREDPYTVSRPFYGEDERECEAHRDAYIASMIRNGWRLVSTECVNKK